jgi:hypothetical protein
VIPSDADADADTGRRLALLRVAFGTILLMYQTGLYGISRVASWAPAFPRHRFASEAAYYLAGFHLPAPGFAWLPVPSLSGYRRLEVAAFLLTLAWSCGLATRVTGPLLAALWSYFLLVSQLSYQHFYFLLCLVLLILAFAPTADHLSADALLRRRWRLPPPPPRSLLPVRLLQGTVSIVYGFSLLSKLNQDWFSGQIIEALRSEGAYAGPLAPLVLASFPPRFLSLFTLAVEGFLVFALWLPATRPLAVALGVALHLGIDAMMPVATYSYQMLGLYLAFVTLGPRAGRRLAFVRRTETTDGLRAPAPATVSADRGGAHADD